MKKGDRVICINDSKLKEYGIDKGETYTISELVPHPKLPCGLWFSDAPKYPEYMGYAQKFFRKVDENRDHTESYISTKVSKELLEKINNPEEPVKEPERVFSLDEDF